jgi:outer membrane biosynthesis protein TonB
VTNKFNKTSYTHVNVFAKFPDGDFEEYVERNIGYPSYQIQNINGEIVIAFSVNPDRNVVNVRLLKNLSPVVDNEVIRVFNTSPKWIPAKLNGKNVSVNIGMRLIITTGSITKTIRATKSKTKP